MSQDSLDFLSSHRRASSVRGTGIQYIPGHVEPFTDLILERHVTSTDSLLDLAGGGLRLALPATMRAKKVTVVDADEKGLKLSAIQSRIKENDPEDKCLRGDYSNLELIQGDALAFLERENRLFNIITCLRFIHFLSKEEIRTLFVYARRRLKEGGILALSHISPRDNANGGLNKVYESTEPLDGIAAGGRKMERRFKNSEEAMGIQKTQNLGEVITIPSSAEIEQIAESCGYTRVGTDIISTRIVIGSIWAKATDIAHAEERLI